MKVSWWWLLALALAANALSACDDDDDDEPQEIDDAERFVVELRPLNGSGATGSAQIFLGSDELGVVLTASGLDETTHLQHIHAGSRCPEASDDDNDDGFIDVVELARATGGILLPLDADLGTQVGADDDFPDGTIIDYEAVADVVTVMGDLRETDPDPDDAVVKLAPTEGLDLATRTIVVHGVTGTLPSTVATLPGLAPTATLPVLCGVIRPADTPQLPDEVDPTIDDDDLRPEDDDGVPSSGAPSLDAVD